MLANFHEWKDCCGRKIPKDEIIFICQVTIALIVIVFGLVNITLGVENIPLWTTLVSGAVGYLLPNPRLSNGAVNVGKAEDSTLLLNNELDEIDSAACLKAHNSQDVSLSSSTLELTDETTCIKHAHSDIYLESFGNDSLDAETEAPKYNDRRWHSGPI